MLVYQASNIAIFMNTPPHIAGIIGGIYNSVCSVRSSYQVLCRTCLTGFVILSYQAMQLGVGIGVSVYGAIGASVTATRAEKGTLTPDDYHGNQAIFYFVVACLVLWAVCTLVFYKVENEWRGGGGIVETNKEVEMAEGISRQESLEKDVKKLGRVEV